MYKKNLIITIDGPAGAGKTTVAQKVAKRLGYLNIDSGSMYRGLTWKVLKENIDLNNEKELVKTVKETKINLKQVHGKFRVIVDTEDVTDKLRTQEINQNINTIADIPEVREYLLKIQHKLGKKGGIIMEGRDIGTAVFPDADKKFYLDADIKERTRRRSKELILCDEKINLSQLEELIRRRDKKDKNRAVNPLRIPKDAILINTTGLSIEQVVQRILKKIRN